MPAQVADLALVREVGRQRREVFELVTVGPYGIELGLVDARQADGAVLRRACDKVIVERRPGDVEHGGRVRAGERVDVGQLAGARERTARSEQAAVPVDAHDRERAAARDLVAQRRILAVAGDEVGVPRGPGRVTPRRELRCTHPLGLRLVYCRSGLGVSA